MSEQWTFEDGWILAVLGNRRRSADLVDFFWSADALQHAIPSRDDLITSVNRLATAGWVEPMSVPTATPQGRVLCKKARRGPWFQTPERVTALLNGGTPPRDGAATWTISEHEYAEAMSRYHADFAKTVNFFTLPWNRKKWRKS